MDIVRIGVVGLGNMGTHHAGYLAAGAVEGARLAAICDVDPQKIERVAGTSDVARFTSHREMFNSGSIDAVMIVTPHFDHPPIALDALARNLHVLSEKPIAVSVSAARRLNDAAAATPNLKFGVMFNQRSRPVYQKLRELIAEGELGQITRITWLITDWFRTWTYYASGGWRATWAGEGGGVLINQCPHNLDLIQWIPNMMPSRITAVGSIGKTHPIEVEDEISAILEYPNGAVGHFVTTTGEAPGTNRLEIAGDQGKIVAESGRLRFARTRRSVRNIRENSPQSFPQVESWDCEIPVTADTADEHRRITQNFVNAVRTGSPLLAPGSEGIRGLEIGNAMLMSGLTRRPVELPLDGAAFDEFLSEMTKKYVGRKTLSPRVNEVANVADSFAKT